MWGSTLTAAPTGSLFPGSCLSLGVGDWVEVDALALFAQVFHGDLSTPENQLSGHRSEEVIDACNDFGCGDVSDRS